MTVVRARRGHQRSLIAGANAWFRAWETARPGGARILDDPWARRLAERDPRILAIRLLRPFVPPLAQVIRELRIAHCVRHRTIDELLLRAIRRDGFQQVVLVGAGYDMRASRLAPDLAGVRWIELDDPLTQDRKWRRLSGRPGVRAVSRAGIDLEREDLAEVLRGATFDSSRSTCFVLEGLLHYLSPRALASLLDAVRAAASPRTRILFTIIDAGMRRSASPTLVHLFRVTGEIPRTFFSVAAARAMLSKHGFDRVQSWAFEEQLEQFVPPQAAGARGPLHTRWWQAVLQADRDV